MRARRPPRHTALAALPAVALDLETTGLDVASDRIVQIGTVSMRGPFVLGEPRLDTRVDPGMPISAASTRVHGITDLGVAGAPRLADLIESLAEMLAGRVVVGQNIHFDLAVLRHEAARAGVPWHEPPALDVGHLASALDRGLVDLGLESLANRFGVTIEARHDALGDSLAAAEIFAALVPRLREADVRTLGEAEAFAARRTDLVRREVEAGWHSSPGQAPAEPLPPPLVRIDSFLYLRRLDEVMSSPARSILPEGTLREAARVMTEQRIGALLVSGTEARPAGIVTERDLLRATTDSRTDPDATPVSSVMSTPVRTMSGGEMIYRALGRMNRLGVRHLCVADAVGAAIGMVSQRDLLHHRASVAAELGDAVACADDAAALAAAHSRLPEVAAMTPAVGLFGRLRANYGRVDLKIGGLLPLVGVARTPALRVGSRARSTPERGRARVVVRCRDPRPDSRIASDIDPRAAARGSFRRRAAERAHRGSAPLAFGAAGTRARTAHARGYSRGVAFIDRRIARPTGTIGNRRIRSAGDALCDRHVGHPHVAVPIDDVCLAQAVGLVGRGLEYLEPEAPGDGLGRVGVASVKAQLHSDSARRIGRDGRMPRVGVIRVMGVQHPLDALPAHHRDVGVAVHDDGIEDFTLKRQRRRNLAHQQIDAEARERPSVVRRRHPWAPCPELGHGA